MFVRFGLSITVVIGLLQITVNAYQYNLNAVNFVSGTNGVKLLNTDNTGNGVVGMGIDFMTGIGDFNGDTRDDFVVCGVYMNARGTCFFIMGKSTPYTANFDLTGLTAGADGFKVVGAGFYDYLGGAISAVGDFNNDGYDDVIVSSAQYPGQQFRGRAYMFFGNAGPFSNVDLGFEFTSALGFHITGATGGAASTTERLGTAIAGGNFNNDAYSDIVVCASTSNLSGRASAGACLVYMGRSGTASSFSNFNMGDVYMSGTSSAGFMVFGAVASDELGSPYTGASLDCDINGDGYDDLMLGAYGAVLSGTYGAVFVIFGRATGSGFSAIDLNGFTSSTTTGFKLTGTTTSGVRFGYMVHSAGDFNHDGIDDMVVSAPFATFSSVSNAGIVWVIFGSTSHGADIACTSSFTSGSAGFVVYGVAGDSLGLAAKFAGDVNADGIDDIIIGAPFGDIGGSIENGFALVLYGHTTATSFSTISMSSFTTGATTGFKMYGNANGHNVGSAISAVGDINGDGVDDVLIRSKETTTQPVYLLYGLAPPPPTVSPSVPPSLPPSATPTVPTSQPSSQPSRRPISAPSSQPTRQPSCQPTFVPSRQPSCQPSLQPKARPTCQPSAQPSRQPSSAPSAQPSCQPTQQPSCRPSMQPSLQPKARPTLQPSAQPSRQPSSAPSAQPSGQPTQQPSCRPSMQPTRQPSAQPSSQPFGIPSGQPTSQPSNQPSRQPSSAPSSQPTKQPSSQPTSVPSGQPSCQPSLLPSARPTCRPSRQPSFRPSEQPSAQPSLQPSRQPSGQPTELPSRQPTQQPTSQPSIHPSAQPSSQPSIQPTGQPSDVPSLQPTLQPSTQPTSYPSDQPSCQPSCQPSKQPSSQPSSRPAVNLLSTIVLSPSYKVHNGFGFAVTTEKGSVYTWGEAATGGDSSAVRHLIASNVTRVVSAQFSFVALKDDGSVVPWGEADAIRVHGADPLSSYSLTELVANEGAYAGIDSATGGVRAFGSKDSGGDLHDASRCRGCAQALSSGVISITASAGSFAAMKADGTVFAWGNQHTGADVSAEFLSRIVGATLVVATRTAFAVLLQSGGVVAWGGKYEGGDTSAVANQLSSDVLCLVASKSVFVAYKKDSSLVTWGYGRWGGDSSTVATELSANVTVVTQTFVAFAALKSDGSVTTWGDASGGGDSSAVRAQLVDVVSIRGNSKAFAALTVTGQVIAWGKAAYGGQIPSSKASALSGSVVAIYQTDRAFAALKSDGSVVVWGQAGHGGSPEAAVEAHLVSGVHTVCSNDAAFSVIKTDSSVVGWGHPVSIPSAGVLFTSEAFIQPVVCA